MARSQRNADAYHAIDLTGSSPEPEPQPRPRQQPRAPTRQTQLYFGHQPRPYGMSRVKNEPGTHQAAFVRNPADQQQVRPINPMHLKMIIETTNPHALQNVLLELCEVSPVFSGALVRGLAPHSISAQELLNQYRTDSYEPNAGVHDEDDSDETYETMKKKLSRPTLATPQSSRLPGQVHGGRSNGAPPNPYGSQSVPRVKLEAQRPSTPGSDGELRRPSRSSHSAPRASSSRTPLQNLPESSSTAGRTPHAGYSSQRLVEYNRTPVRAAKTCIKCHEPFTDDTEPCIFHPGTRMRLEDSSVVWDCCQEGMYSAGCDFGGSHITENDATADPPMQRKRPSESPVPEGARQKRPRAS